MWYGVFRTPLVENEGLQDDRCGCSITNTSAELPRFGVPSKKYSPDLFHATAPRRNALFKSYFCANPVGRWQKAKGPKCEYHLKLFIAWGCLAVDWEGRDVCFFRKKIVRTWFYYPCMYLCPAFEER